MDNSIEESRKKQQKIWCCIPAARKEQIIRHKKIKRLQWMLHMYQDGKEDDQIGGSCEVACCVEDPGLLEWSQQLNFEDYIRSGCHSLCQTNCEKSTGQSSAEWLLSAQLLNQDCVPSYCFPHCCAIHCVSAVSSLLTGIGQPPHALEVLKLPSTRFQSTLSRPQAYEQAAQKPA